MQIKSNNLDETADYVANMRKWSPYFWGGKLFIINHAGTSYIYRNEQSIKAQITRLGIGEAMMMVID